MRRVEKLGIELAYALRERNSRRELYEHSDTEVRRLEREILEASSTADTGSQPIIPDERPTERFAGPDFEQCPGQACPQWRQGQEHAHLGGRVWVQ